MALEDPAPLISEMQMLNAIRVAAESGGGGSTAPITTLLGLTGGIFVAANGGTATGDVDLYTVPAGKRLFVISANAYNSTAGTISADFYWQAYISGAYRPLTTLVSSIASASSHTFAQPLVLEAGEKISLSAGATGTTIALKGILYDNSVPLYSPRLTSVSVGNNTLYTCPASTNAFITSSSMALNAGNLPISNSTGGSITYKVYVVPSGGSPAQSNIYTPSAGTALANNTLVNVSMSHVCCNSGDFCVYNTDVSTAGQFVWTTVCETPN